MFRLPSIPHLATGLLVLTITACSSQGADPAQPPVQPESGPLTSQSSAQTSDQAGAGSQDSAAQQSPSAQPKATFPYPADTRTASSLSVVVNKKNPLKPLSYAPDDLRPLGGVYLRAEAQQAAQEMFADAAQAGAPITAVSGYRSYETQQGTYASWVAQYGSEQADVASARPGYSEHQTGLALDIGDGGGCDLKPCFKDTAAARWVAEHAHEYGFILRYPWMEHEKTGYWYESWHLRYIGREQATAYQESGAKTLEEFYGLPAAPTY